GPGVAALYGLDRTGLEFLLAARVLQQQQSAAGLDAVAVATIAEQSADDLRIKRKSLGQFVQGLEQRGFVRMLPALAGRGGTRTSFELLEKAIHVTEEQLRELLAQSQAGFALSELL